MGNSNIKKYCYICKVKNHIKGLYYVIDFNKIYGGRTYCNQCLFLKNYINTHNFKKNKNSFFEKFKKCVYCRQNNKTLYLIFHKGKYNDLIICDFCLKNKILRKKQEFLNNVSI